MDARPPLAAILAVLALAGCSRQQPAQTPPPAPKAPPPAPAATSWMPYVCSDGRIVQALYPDSGTAQVKLGETVHAMKVAISASGARYVGDGLQWWTKGEEGMLAPLKPGEEIASADGVACVPPARAPVEPPRPGAPGGLPDDRMPLDERPAKPGSAQEAASVVESYYALVESGRVAEAAKLRIDGKQEDLTPYAQLHAQVGAPGPVEGAAGSLFVEVPVVLYGRLTAGPEHHASGKATLRRVNNVPGATPDQLKWRIEKIEVTPSR